MSEQDQETRGGYLAAVAKRKGISIDEARAEMVQVQKRKVLDLAEKIENEKPEGGENA